MIKGIKERIVAATGSLSGAASILGSWQVCHNVCLFIIAALGLIGITLIGMPLAFFTEIAIPMWSIAVALLLATLYMYYRKMCISRNLIVINSGLIIAGIPFQQLQKFSIFFWAIGGILALAGISLFVRERMQKKRSEHDKK